MQLDKPFHQLKRDARRLARQEQLPLHQALDRIAQTQGYKAWSLLVAKTQSSRANIWNTLLPGEMLLMGARRGHGKTLAALEIGIAAMQAGHRCYFFSLDFTVADVTEAFTLLGQGLSTYADRFEFDDSDAICAPYIITKLANAEPNTLIIVDYLQLLDQRRDNPQLEAQIVALKDFARQRQLTLVFISQINRHFDGQNMPSLNDVRLPNPLQLTHFTKVCFLHNGNHQLQAIA